MCTTTVTTTITQLIRGISNNHIEFHFKNLLWFNGVDELIRMGFQTFTLFAAIHTFRRTAERHGGLIYLWDDAAAELAADPDKALKWIMDYIRSNESVPAEAFSPDIIEERDTSEAALRAFRASYRNAYIQILAAAKKYYIICAQWPTSDLYCEVKPKREQKGAPHVYDPTPIENYRIYEISQLTKQQAGIRLDMEDPEKVTRMMEEDRLRDLGLL